MVDDSLGEAIDGGEAIETVQAQRAPFHTPVCAKLIADRPPGRSRSVRGARSWPPSILPCVRNSLLTGRRTPLAGDERLAARARTTRFMMRAWTAETHASSTERTACRLLGAREPRVLGSMAERGARAWVRDACQRLSACADCEQLEEIIFDEAQRFVPAVLDAAFVALARVGFGSACPCTLARALCDAAYRTLLSEATLAGTSGHDLRGMGAVLLAHALDMLQSCEPAHMIAMLQAMGLMGLVVEDDIMLDFVRHIVLTLDSFDASAVVHVLLGLAMLEHQPDENSLRAFESKVSALTAHFDTGAHKKPCSGASKDSAEPRDVQSAREAYRRE